MKKVSILVPIYGVEQYISKCAQTLFEQSYPNIEYVFVNDCTKDKSISILKDVITRYPERSDMVKIIDHETNQGLGGARSTAIRNATGDYIIHVDSDDFLALNAVEALILKAEKTGADIVDGGYYDFHTNNLLLESHLPLHIDSLKYIKILVSRVGLTSNQIWGRLIKRDLYFEKNTINVPGIDFAEDYSVLPILLDGTKRDWIDDCVYYYRNDNVSSYMHHISQKNIISCIKAHDLVYDYFNTSKINKEVSFFIDYGMLNLLSFCKDNGYRLLESKYYRAIDLDSILLKFYAITLRSNFTTLFSHIVNILIKKLYVEPLLK